MMNTHTLTMENIKNTTTELLRTMVDETVKAEEVDIKLLVAHVEDNLLLVVWQMNQSDIYDSNRFRTALKRYVSHVETEVLSTTRYEQPVMGGSMAGSRVSVTGEQTVRLYDGRVVEQYLYNIVGYTAKNGNEFVSLKCNIYLSN
jgi:hypothetical protein